MRNFVYIIGTMDDFESYEALEAAYRDGTIGDYNASVYPVSLSEDCKVKGYDALEELAVMIARGEAMSDDWCLDGTFGDLIEVE